MTKSGSPNKVGWLSSDRRRLAAGFDRVLLYEFDMLEEHRHFVEVNFSSAAQKLNKRYIREIKAIRDAEQKATYAESMIDQYVSVVDELPRLQWYAQFLVVYASFEHALNQLCQIVKRRSNYSLSVTDLAGQGILRASSYLRKVAGVNSPFNTASWNRAVLLGEVRNAIAHRNGRIDLLPQTKSSLAFKLEKISGVRLKQLVPDQEDADIILEPVFVQEAIVTLRAVLADISNYELYGAGS